MSVLCKNYGATNSDFEAANIQTFMIIKMKIFFKATM